MREVGHELERREDGLVVLMLVLHDHAVDEAAREQRLAAVEIDVREHVEGALAHVGDEPPRLGWIEDRKRRAVAARVLERVVHVVEELVGGRRAGELPQEPQLLVVADVREVPTQR